MKNLISAIVLFALASCATHLPTGTWQRKDASSEMTFKILDDGKCFFFAGGGIDGIGGDCVYEKHESNIYFIYSIGRDGNIEKNDHIEFEYSNNATFIMFGRGDKKIKLPRASDATNQ